MSGHGEKVDVSECEKKGQNNEDTNQSISQLHHQYGIQVLGWSQDQRTVVYG